ncbi:MAG: Lrp/AsnC family transcriptional regulator [Halodesulfurarchaeum sp.]
MVIAYILIKANTSEADRLLEDVSNIENIVDAHVVAGDVDLIAKAEVDAPQEIKDIVANRIQDLDGVENTETYISME